MATLLGIIIFLFILAYGHKEYTQLKTGISTKGLSPAAQAAVTAFIRENTLEHESVLDASSGWGKSLFFMSENLPRHKITGVEFSFVPWLVCNFRSFAHRDAIGNTNLLKTDIFKTDLRPYSVVIFNFPQKIADALLPKINRELSASSFLISVNTQIKDMTPVKKIAVSDPEKSRLYIYKGNNVEKSAAASDNAGESVLKPLPGQHIFSPGMIIGHRGFGKTAPYEKESASLSPEERTRIPENTYEACMKAMQSGAAGVEIDVIMSKDGELIVCHDNDLSFHMTRDNLLKFGAMKISEQPYNVIKSLPIGYAAFKSATLDEILFLTIKYNAVINIELKGKNTAAAVITRIHKYVSEKSLNKNNIVISSFDHSQIKTVHELDGDIKTGLLFISPDTELSPIYPEEPGSPYYQKFSGEYLKQIYDLLKPFSVHIPHDLVSPETFSVLGQYALSCFIYHTAEPVPEENTELLSSVYNLRKRGIPVHLITDYPEIIARIFADTDAASDRQNQSAQSQS